MAQQRGISDIFYYFEKFTDLENNRTVGRKIGVLQEVVIRKYLERSTEVSDRMLSECPVVGVSGATHKIEFVVCSVADRLRLTRNQPVDYGGIEMEMMAVEGSSAGISVRWESQEAGRKVALKNPLRRGGNFGNARVRDRFKAEGLIPRMTAALGDAVELSLLDPRSVLNLR